jgi:glutamate/aspartate transport system substrate-binding protein
VKSRHLLAALAFVLAPALALAQPLDGRLKKIKESKTIAIAHRTDAAPFSFVNDKKEPVGYSVDLCKRVVNAIGEQIGVPDLKIKWVAATTQNRFDVVAKGEADMECGASSVTLGRMRQVDFSSFIFVDSTALLVHKDVPGKSLGELSGKKIGVVTGTTNERALATAMKDRMVSATVVPLKTREEGLAKLEAKEIDAFAADRILLLGMAGKAKDAKSLAMLDDDLSIEGYAIALPRGDAGLRLAVNTGLSKIYRSAAIGEIYGAWFGSLGKPSKILLVTFLFGALPE